ASRDSLYRTAGARRQVRSGVNAFPLALLPRRCPRCCQDTITGHGRRRKPAHDERHDWIWIRRGVCRPCGLTFTILPQWSPPYGQYSFRCREQAWEATVNHGSGWEQSAPQTKDPQRLPGGTGRSIAALSGHQACVVNAVWTLDRRFVLSCDSDGGLRMSAVADRLPI